MSDIVPIVVAAIAAIGAIAAATISALALVQLKVTHDLVNSKMELLLEKTEELGRIRGRDAERERQEES